MSRDSDPSGPPPLDVMTYLYDALDTFEMDLDAEYGPPEAEEDRAADEALTLFASRVMEALYNPAALRKVVSEVSSELHWDSKQRLQHLLHYRYVHEVAERDVARTVVDRLHGVRDRVKNALLALLLLQDAAPSDTALKYLRQVVDLYLAGYTTEVVVMCGAVLEAAIRDRVPDSLLLERGYTAAFKRTGDYSLAQRMKLEDELGILTEDLRRTFWSVVNARNDAVHVQPDIGPDIPMTLWFTAALLGAIRPVDTGASG
jgi:hypothetical protein